MYRSVAAVALRNMAARVALVVCATTLATAWHLLYTLDDRAVDTLETYIRERVPRESAPFLLAESTLRTLGCALHEELVRPPASGAAGLDARFGAHLVRRADGRWTDTEPEPSAMSADAPPTHPMDADAVRVLSAGWPLVEAYGGAWRAQFENTYLITPAGGAIVFWPGKDFGRDTATDFDMTGEEYHRAATPAENPTRAAAWTGIYRDRTAREWMASIVVPVDVDGRWVAAVGHDVLLEDLLERARIDHLPGATNILFREDGRLISHPDFADRILASGGTYTLSDANSPELEAIYRAVVDTPDIGRGIVVDHPAGDAWLAIGRIEGPGWYFVVEYPKSLNRLDAFQSAGFVLLLGTLSLILEVAILYVVLRRQVSEPLHALASGTAKVAKGDLSVRLDVARNDELGRLAECFNEMTSAVAHRDEQLARQNARLEADVARRTSELSEANRELESFSFSVSHDLRAPLRSITGFAALLRTDHAEALGPEGLRAVDRIAQSARRGHEIIEDLLALARVVRTETRRTDVDLGAIAREVAEALRRAAPERSVEFVLEEGMHAFADPGLLRILLERLLENAWKYTERHATARIEVGTERSGDEVVYFVRDDGAGFEMAHVDRLFLPFSRLHGNAEFEGTGIGLAIAHRIVVRHGGRIWAEGSVERGATFRFVLPPRGSS
ncbi:MAG: ATP-binding protein [Pseudomonadota bacterium]|nr:ATP-binding protein [Pseudomonadota bacterium]